jgi:Na+/melibiose symporter-like transporter
MVGGIFTGFAASWVLHRWASPINYRVSFLICDVVWTVSTVPLFFLRDRPRRSTAAPAAGFFRSFVAKMKVLLGNPNYRIFLFFHMLNSVAFTITTFIIPFSKERLGIPDSRLAWLSVIFLAANAGFGTLMGRLADRVGYRSVGALQSVLLVATYAVALSAQSFAAVGIAYALASLVNMSTSFVLVNMSVELCPTLGVSDLTALGGTLLLPFAATVVPLAGKVIDSTGSYPTVFLMGMTIAVIALCGFSLLVREPRTGRLYVIKQINMR